MVKNAYSEITNEIRISVEPEAMMDASEPALKRYAFSYTVTIENLGSSSVLLLERYWMVKSAGEPIAEVVGPGVVGQQPMLDCGQSFSYTSGTVISDPVGSMEGRYTFRRNDGKFVEAKIPIFDLLYPSALH